MALVDLTFPIEASSAPFQTREKLISNRAGAYTGVIHDFHHNSMAGSYIDFPGHVRETDDGLDAATYPPEKFFRVPAAVIRLNRAGGSGKILAPELESAFGDQKGGGALVVNALGRRRFDEIASRSVYLGRDAVQWIINKKFHLLVSDVYESDSDPQNVFPDLFRAGISTVCCPVNLHLLTGPGVRVTVLFPRFSGAVQLPCRILAETGCSNP